MQRNVETKYDYYIQPNLKEMCDVLHCVDPDEREISSACGCCVWDVGRPQEAQSFPCIMPGSMGGDENEQQNRGRGSSHYA